MGVFLCAPLRDALDEVCAALDGGGTPAGAARRALSLLVPLTARPAVKAALLDAAIRGATLLARLLLRLLLLRRPAAAVVRHRLLLLLLRLLRLHGRRQAAAAAGPRGRLELVHVPRAPARDAGAAVAVSPRRQDRGHVAGVLPRRAPQAPQLRREALAGDALGRADVLVLPGPLAPRQRLAQQPRAGQRRPGGRALGQPRRRRRLGAARGQVAPECLRRAVARQRRRRRGQDVGGRRAARLGGGAAAGQHDGLHDRREALRGVLLRVAAGRRRRLALALRVRAQRAHRGGDLQRRVLLAAAGRAAAGRRRGAGGQPGGRPGEGVGRRARLVLRLPRVDPDDRRAQRRAAGGVRRQRARPRAGQQAARQRGGGRPQPLPGV